MQLIIKSLLLSIVIMMFIPFMANASEEEDYYRLSVENEWYPVQDEYDNLELPYILYTLDAVFTDSEEEREAWTRQVDDTIANELWDFFHQDTVKGLTYTDEVLDYLDENFEIDEGGFLSAIGNFFKSIVNFFSNLF
ncbi:hypothetical protein [Alkalibacillus silvisoli]|uniref:Sporulation protein n=1 Tax=Alkalibacillus silvisoli TaxID=392823 RepID=A0ABN0ZXV5_9BACI